MKGQHQEQKRIFTQERCDSSLFVTKEVERHVEKILYQYPMLKVNLSFCAKDLNSKISQDGLQNDVDSYNATNNQAYQEKADIVDAALASLPDFEQAFIRKRYFDRKPYKTMADELGVVERHLYRIRRKVLIKLATAFGIVAVNQSDLRWKYELYV